MIAARHKFVGHFRRKGLPLRNRQQMLLALGPDRAHERRGIEPIAIFEEGPGNVNGIIECEFPDNVGLGASGPCQLPGKPRASRHFDRIRQPPDDLAENGKSWRQHLVEYNKNAGNNPLGLYPAFQLYQGGPFAALFSGATKFIVRDTFQIAVNNAFNSRWQVRAEQLFGMRALGLQLPSSLTPTIPDSLIG